MFPLLFLVGGLHLHHHRDCCWKKGRISEDQKCVGMNERCVEMDEKCVGMDESQTLRFSRRISGFLLPLSLEMKVMVGKRRKHQETWIKSVINSITLGRDQDLLPHNKKTELRRAKKRISLFKGRNAIDLDPSSLPKGSHSPNSFPLCLPSFPFLSSHPLNKHQTSIQPIPS